MEGREIVIYENRFRSFFISSLVGVLIGAGVALLVAPQSGVETRRAIGERGNQIKDRAVHTIGNTRDKAQDAVTSVCNRLGRGGSSVHELKEENKILEDSVKRTYDL
jgi:gas vesicle protein